MSSLKTLLQSALGIALAASILGTSSPVHAQTISIQSELVIQDLDRPVGLYAPDGDTSRIFVLEQTGKIRLYSLPDYSLLGTYLDLGLAGLNLVTTPLVLGDERGLLGLAFHPNFAANGFFYVNYTAIGTGTTVIRRYTATAPFTSSTTASTTSGTSILTVAQDFANHNGGSIRFGPDNMLYVFMGDGGSANDPNNRAQDDSQLLGKILRLDVNDTSAADGDGLFIPNNNPFRALGNPRDKVWSKGMRNPWRSTFDRVTGRMWVADVGQDNREEVNVQPAIMLADPADGNSTITNAAAVASLNYGWDCREGLIACPTGLGGSGQGCVPSAGGYFNPIVDYTHSLPSHGCSITGGYVYRGAAIPALDGMYLYADYCTSQTNRALRYDGANVTFHTDLVDQLQHNGSNLNSITSYGEDGAGEMYICRSPTSGNPVPPGSIYKIIPFTSPCGCPCDLPDAVDIFTDSFETNLGWTASGVAIGAWVRAQPINTLGGTSAVPTQWDPMTDADGTGWCALTGNGNSNDDVDGGSTTFTSPALDFIAGQISICYSYQFATAGDATGDGLFVEVSSNGTTGPFILVASHTADQSNRWIPHVVTTAALASAGVANTSNMRVRFIALDTGTANTVEAAFDNFKIVSSTPDTCACDWDNSGGIGVPDIFAFLSSWFANEPAADFDGQDGRTVADIFAFLACWFAGCP